ncbi:GntR family transcriptional regulator [Bifidobacterium catulorum]|uniref:HTH gntR-type domain-containing protein n=1 Tax=Bifidobacterium catulorum TaxID=1630173 RepID=A0A2U2MPV7_9BIFI|nr:GntR family transcriptional regulator [Bifidobacterium catulorum]PWG58880.1 hypothetical protein DF200_10525 [Bifidobacterium catulorum]
MALSKKDIAYAYMRNRIITGALKAGTVLDELAVAQELDMSRTPVHEAVNRLADEKFLVQTPRRGAMVYQMSFKDIVDLLNIRLAIEPSLLRKAIPNLDRSALLKWKSTLNECLSAGRDPDDLTGDDDADAGRDLDYDFHLFFAKQTENQFAVDILSMLMTQNQRSRYLVDGAREDRAVEVYREHLHIVDCALSGDEEATVKAMEDHLRNGFITKEQLHSLL